MSRSTSRRVWSLLGLIALIVQLVAVYRPSEPALPTSLPGLDKFGHAAIFAAPVFCLLLASRSIETGRLGRSARWPVPVIFFVHAVVSELIQHAFLAHRDGDPFDVLADAVGISLGLGAAFLISRPLPRIAVGAGHDGTDMTKQT